MRCCLFFLILFLMLPFVSSCDFVTAGPAVAKRWISTHGGVGIELKKQGNRFSGKMYWPTRDGQRFSDFLTYGLYDKENDTIVFPLAVRRGTTFKKLRAASSKYVEVELNFDGEELVGEWRTGSEPPESVRMLLSIRRLKYGTLIGSVLESDFLLRVGNDSEPLTRILLQYVSPSKRTWRNDARSFRNCFGSACTRSLSL